MQVSYVVQDKWKDGPWEDHNEYMEPAPAIALLGKRKADPIWRGEGNREWRLVRRTVVNELVED